MGLSSRYMELAEKGVPDFHNNELLKACLHDEELLSEVLVQNKEFALSIITNYIGSMSYLKATFKVEEDDLLQLAYIGIINALRTFDFSRNIKFTTYCYRPIVWEINPYLYKDSWIVPLSRSSVKLLKDIHNLTDELGDSPSPEVIAERLDVPIERVMEIQRFAGGLYSLDYEENVIQSSKFMYDDPYSEADTTLTIENLIKDADFDDFEKKVIELMLQDYTNSKIAEELNVYPMTINRAQEKMREKALRGSTAKKTTKYVDEVEVVAEAIEERGYVLPVEEIHELLDVCGFDTSSYSLRVLYYIRQRAISTSNQ